MGSIRIGNSGWSYKDWIGSFYPKGAEMGELLGLYFEHFLTVEVNSTFYRLPRSSSVKKWAETASRREGRDFCIKVPREISHVAAMSEDRTGMDRLFKEFSSVVLEPLEDAGVLGAVLFQASPYFSVRGDIKYRMKSEPKVPMPEYTLGRKRLEEIIECLVKVPGVPVVELRNSSWLTEKVRLDGETSALLRRYGVALAVVDGPSFPWIEEDTAPHQYVRFHGRNKEGWFKSDEKDPHARYDYRYSREELGERVDRIKVLSRKVESGTRVLFNNHPRGMAPLNALQMMDLLGIPRPTGALDSFV